MLVLHQMAQRGQVGVQILPSGLKLLRPKHNRMGKAIVREASRKVGHHVMVCIARTLRMHKLLKHIDSWVRHGGIAFVLCFLFFWGVLVCLLMGYSNLAKKEFIFLWIAATCAAAAAAAAVMLLWWCSCRKQTLESLSTWCRTCGSTCTWRTCHWSGLYRVVH